MKLNLLQNKIVSIQDSYAKLLSVLIPELESGRVPEALDEINLFWIRNIDVVQLYLKAMFSGNESYVFTAATFMDFDDKEHLPFLMIGEKHILDDPLNRYSEIYNKISNSNDMEYLYNQIRVTAKDNLKILKDVKNNILILPLRILNQSSTYKSLFQIGEQAFISLFDEIKSLKDYFNKCNSINDIMRYARKDFGKLVMFSESDDESLEFEKRYEIALSETHYMVDSNKSDSYNFFILVFGCIQQAIDIIASCIEYGCIPYIRYPVAFHYISLLSENMTDIEQIIMLRYKMSIAFVVYRLCDKERLATVSIDEFLIKNQEYNFNKRLFCTLEQNGINERNFLGHTVTQVVIDELEKFYSILNNKDTDE